MVTAATTLLGLGTSGGALSAGKALGPGVWCVFPGPPDFEEELADCTAELGETVKLACRVTGTPKPIVSWYKGRSPWAQGAGLATRKSRPGGIRLGRDQDPGAWSGAGCQGQAGCLLPLLPAPKSKTAWPGRMRWDEGKGVHQPCLVGADSLGEWTGGSRQTKV